METLKVRFVADSMLGKLAKWLRVLGYDTRYKSYYGPGVIDQLVEDGGRVLSRRKETTDLYKNAVLIRSTDTGGQMEELRQKIDLAPDRSKWFSRCLICNVLLKEVDTGEARENVPEYVFYKNMIEIRFCPSCGRYFWPGTHRDKMEETLIKLGF